MKSATKLIAFILIAAATSTVMVVQYRSAKHEAENETIKADVRQPGIVRFGKGEPQLAAIRTELVTSEPMPEADPVNGRIVYDENLTARVSSPLAGRVLALRAGVGDRVSRGVTLLELDSPELGSAEADLSKSASAESRQRLAYERAKLLYEHEVIARKEFEAAEADYQQARADARRASLRMRSLQAFGHESGKFLLRSPVGGVVVERNVNPGQEVRPDLQAPLFLVTDIGHLWVVADVPEKSLSHVKLGQTVGIETDAWPNQQFTAKVERIGIAVDPLTRRVQVRCTIANKDLKLKPEMFTRVSFLAEAGHKGVRVPNTGLIAEGLYTYVFVEKEPGSFEKRQVKLALRGNDHSFVESGLAEGERVVVEGALLLNSEALSDAK
jgi:cobalt-zinc-cadmium efflux system membrane fusion protein